MIQLFTINDTVIYNKWHIIYIKFIPTSPVATASGKDLPLNTITDMIEANKFLQLPRLSNQEVIIQYWSQAQTSTGVVFKY